MPIAIMPDRSPKYAVPLVSSKESTAASLKEGPLEFQSPLAIPVELRHTREHPHVGEFGLTRTYPNGSPKPHDGIDMRCPVGTLVFASEDGTAYLREDPKGYGHYLVIRHENGYETLYGHLSEREVVAGQKIKKGDFIGLSGISGNADDKDPHLHFEIRRDGKPMNPVIFLPALSADGKTDELINPFLKV